MEQEIAVFWFRRDLRLHDNAGLLHALKSGLPVLPLFILDADILDSLTDRSDARVSFIHQELTRMDKQLRDLGSGMLVKYGRPIDVWRQLLQAFPVKAVFTNSDYEPYALERDRSVSELLRESGIPFAGFKDHVIFEKNEVIKDDGSPYTVFTPYSRKWSAILHATPHALQPFDSAPYFQGFIQQPDLPALPTLADIGFWASGLSIPPKSVSQGLIKNYDKTRDFPAIEGTSRLGIHFRFGTISIREKAQRALELNQVYVNELIWRDFYAQILYHFPQVVTRAFRPEYDRIQWRNDEEEFRRWCEGRTGYPIVDAGMRELNETGYMHNRVRMITASFLTKHLLIDWRWGEAYFASKLLDFDLASNNGGWQWAAGCGTDAAPYFRVFNPTAQQQKFDKDFLYVRQWVQEWGSAAYPAPMVDHQMARARCLETYKAALSR
ncbi:MAG: deoxyribodipyrimidine photo-lyase [Saprospiraceae bacterium]|nr:deoxyribodipyrimidine photo-lyase [Saprospiraceae bacterium]